MIQNSLSDDPTGLQTLQNLETASALNKWLFDAISPYCSGNILEAGSGIGNISYFLVHHFNNITLSDFRKEYCDILEIKYTGNKNLNSIAQINLSLHNFKEIYPFHLNKYDTIIALNVLEHIKEDELAIRNCRDMLAPNGHLILLVPAYQDLYNILDKNLDHIKRYNKTTLSKLVKQGGMQVMATKYFNFVGLFGWWFTGKILQRKIIPAYQINLFNRFIPLFKFIDRLLFNKVGLSVIIVGQRVDL